MGYSDFLAAEAAFNNAVVLAGSVSYENRSASSTAPTVPRDQVPSGDIRIGGKDDMSMAEPSSAVKSGSLFAVEDLFDSDGFITRDVERSVSIRGQPLIILSPVFRGHIHHPFDFFIGG